MRVGGELEASTAKLTMPLQADEPARHIRLRVKISCHKPIKRLQIMRSNVQRQRLSCGCIWSRQQYAMAQCKISEGQLSISLPKILRTSFTA